MQELRIEDFPLRSFDKVRYADTDRQGHVNNAVFSSFLETGRVEVLYSKELPVLSEGASFVIASLKLDFASEMTWPGQVDIGTGILKIGNSSVILYQELFQGGIRVAKAETIIVQIHNDTKASFPLGENARGI
ncbi:MAG: thioesterase family protein, partial [Bacteroidota bacterium]